MEHEAATFKMLETLLNGDAILTQNSSGAFFENADPETPTPFLTYRVTGEARENSLGGEAVRSVFFRVKTHFTDRDGATYANGHLLWSRVLRLLDGKARGTDKRQQMPEVLASLNTILAPLGYRAIFCALETAIPTMGNAIPPSQISTSFSTGGVFHLKLRLS